MKAKFVICLLSILCVMAGQGAAETIYVENHSFEEPGTDKTHGWDEEDGAVFYDQVNGEVIGPAEVPGWESDGEVEDSGVSYETDNVPVVEDGLWYGYIMGSDPTVYQLTDHTIAAGEYYTLTFDAYSVYDGPTVQASFYYQDGLSRVPVATGTVTGLENDAGYAVVGTVVFVAYDAPDAIGKQLGIEFDNPENDDDFQYGSWTAMDDVHLDMGISYANAIYPPKDGTNILLDATLEWFLDEGYTCNVYFGADPNVRLNEMVLEDTLDTTYDPGGPEGLLDYDTTYYWCVDTNDPNEGGTPVTLPGVTWSFTTITEYVVITREPANTTVPVGGTAEFSVDALSVTDISYEWYKDVKFPGTDILVTTDEVLTIEDVQLADEGYYYCVLTNEKAPTVSTMGRLMTERMVGWWKLDGNLSDSVTEVVPGVETHSGDVTGDDPDYVSDGIDGGMAVDFTGDGRVISLHDSSEYFNFYPQGMTISLWIRVGADRDDGVMNKQMIPEDPYSDSVGWLIGANSSIGAEFTVHPEDTLSGMDDYGDIFDSEWHLLTAVTDPGSQTFRIYVDGVVRSESDAFDLGSLPLNTEPVIIGAEDSEGLNAFRGQVDDIRMWNYPLETLDIAILYLDYNEDKDICLYQDEDWLKFDYAGEPGEASYCRINIEDMVEFASTWLECHLVPTCVE
jgi:hypothetical protein